MNEKKCPNCGGYDFSVAYYIDRDTGKEIYEGIDDLKNKYKKRRSFLMVLLGIIILLIGGGLSISKIASEPLYLVGIGIGSAILLYYGLDLFGVIFSIPKLYGTERNFTPFFLYGLTFVFGAVVEYAIGYGTIFIILMGIVFLLIGIQNNRKLNNQKSNWKPVYQCGHCSFSMAWEPGDPYPEIHDNPALRELGRKRNDDWRRRL